MQQNTFVDETRLSDVPSHGTKGAWQQKPEADRSDKAAGQRYAQGFSRCSLHGWTATAGVRSVQP